MSSEVSIGGNTSGLDAALQKAQNSVGKATAGIGRGLANALGASLGPFGELIEKFDTFRAAIGGVSLGTKVMAGAVGAAFVGTAFLVEKAVDTVKSYNELLEKNKKLRQEINDSQDDFISKIMKEGVETENVAMVTDLLNKQKERLIKENEKINADASLLDIPGPMPAVFQDAIAKNLEEIKVREEAILKIREKSSQEMANQSAFQRNISDEAEKSIQDEKRKRFAASFDASGLDSLKKQREMMVEARQNVSNDRTGAITANVLTSQISEADALIKLIEEKVKGGKQSGQVRFTELASVGGGSAMGGISARQDATKDIVANGKTTNQLLRELRDVWRNLNLR